MPQSHHPRVSFGSVYGVSKTLHGQPSVREEFETREVGAADVLARIDAVGKPRAAVVGIDGAKAIMDVE